MPKYRVTERSLFGGVVVEAGATVEYDGNPGRNLQPLDAEGAKRKKDYEATLVHKTDAEQIGEAVGNAIAQPKKKAEAENVDHASQPRVVDPGANAGPTTIGHSSVVEKSVGGSDADNLLHENADGKLEHDNPNSAGPTTAKADPAPKRTDDDPREAKQSVGRTAAKKSAKH